MRSRKRRFYRQRAKSKRLDVEMRQWNDNLPSKFSDLPGDMWEWLRGLAGEHDILDFAAQNEFLAK